MKNIRQTQVQPSHSYDLNYQCGGQVFISHLPLIPFSIRMDVIQQLFLESHICCFNFNHFFGNGSLTIPIYSLRGNMQGMVIKTFKTSIQNPTGSSMENGEASPSPRAQMVKDLCRGACGAYRSNGKIYLVKRMVPTLFLSLFPSTEFAQSFWFCRYK